MGALTVAFWLTVQIDPFEAERHAMVRETIQRRGIRNADVLLAMREVRRHLFVPESLWSRAYGDHPLPIGRGQTISQPYIVALMSEMLGPERRAKVLEVGTGSGYQAAVLARLFGHVYSIELIPELARQAEAVLKSIQVSNVTVRVGDGYAGWPERAPFDRILLTAAPPQIPQVLIDQLAPGGRLVAPEGASPEDQVLVTVEKSANGTVTRRRGEPVRFVPMVPSQR
jgi:protein-L-isoaspartate(D-aspartate) O-methyltransferase